MAIMDVYTQALCRAYTIPCPACGTGNSFPRLKPDINRASKSEADGHPLAYSWRIEGDVPPWLTPLNYFWGVCTHCFYTALLDDADFRRWKSNATKYRSQFHEAALETLSDQADRREGIAQQLGTNIEPDDIFGSLLVQFSLGVYAECLKVSPTFGLLGRAYLRMAWVYRDQERVYQPFVQQSSIRQTLEEAAPLWNKAILPNSSYPIQPQLVTDEVAALRQALAFFESNYVSMQSARHEDEMRLMSLIAEIGYRIYEITGQEEDFVKGQSLFSGTMQRSLSIIKDKTIVGGAVNRARDTLEKAGERGRELRILKKKWEKTPPTKQPAETTPSTPQPEPEAPSEMAPEPPAPPVAPAPLVSGGTNDLHELQQKLDQLDEENKRWMRLAGISEVTGLPNRVMLSRVLLPGAFRQAIARKEAIGCILLSPEGLQEINGKYGRDRGDQVIRKFSECIQEQVRKGERLCHLEGVNFGLVVPRMTQHQLGRRAAALHKELTSRRFNLGPEALSIKVSVGVAAIEHPTDYNAKALQEALYSRSVQALDAAKLQGNHIQISTET